jgi:hypothetical protein
MKDGAKHSYNVRGGGSLCVTVKIVRVVCRKWRIRGYACELALGLTGRCCERDNVIDCNVDGDLPLGVDSYGAFVHEVRTVAAEIRSPHVEQSGCCPHVWTEWAVSAARPLASAAALAADLSVAVVAAA